MGTNFYAVIPMKKHNKRVLKFLKHLQTHSDEGDYDIYKFQEQINGITKGKKIHLGKRSDNLSFYWDANELKYYKPSLKSIHKWIENNNAIIEDEYEKKYSWDEFLNKEIGKCLYTSKAIKSIKELPNDMDFDTIKYIKETYLDKNLPYFQYCSNRTYHIMHPNKSFYYNNYNSHSDFTHYAKNKFVDKEYCEFHSKDGLRFATYTDFS